MITTLSHLSVLPGLLFPNSTPKGLVPDTLVPVPDWLLSHWNIVPVVKHYRRFGEQMMADFMRGPGGTIETCKCVSSSLVSDMGLLTAPQATPHCLGEVPAITPAEV